jgi:hypothetical protein
MGINAGDALRLLSQHPSIGGAIGMGLLGGGSALTYNAISQPTLDDYGNTIESNDINPFAAALGSAVIGAVGGGIYGHYNQPVAKPVQSMSAGMSPQPRQSPDIGVTPTWQQQTQNEIDGFRNEVAELRGHLNKKRNDYAQGVNDLWEASTPIRQIVPANPMEMQNPMSPPGMKTVVVQQPPKAPGQEMMEESLRLRELAAQQRQQKQLDARLAMGSEGWNTTQNRWMQTNHPEDRQQNAAGWDVMLPQNNYEKNRELAEIDRRLAQKKIA